MPDVSPESHGPPVSPGSARERMVLAKKWAYLLLSAVFVPVPQLEFERELLQLFDAVCAAVRSEPFNIRAAHDAGVRLVELGCVGEAALPCTVDVVGKGLVSFREFQPIERFAERIVLGLGALAVGFAEANRRVVLEQQENLNLSLLKAVHDVRSSLEESEERFDQVARSSASGIATIGLDGKLLKANAAVGSILGYSKAELLGTNLFDLVPPDQAAALRESYQGLLDGDVVRFRQSQRLVCKNGDIAHVSLTASVLRGPDDRPSHFCTVIEDGTELSLLQSELIRQTMHDALTGLPNRQRFGTEVGTALRRADPRLGITVFHLDLDAFALICNGLGRRVGEQLLVAVARRLKAVFGNEKAMVARFDGDEFAILVENSRATPGIPATVSNINAELAEPIYGDDHGVAVSASIGVVHRPAPDADPAEVLRAADQALRKAKAAGRGQWALFHADEDDRDRQTYALAAAMPGAWENGEIKVVYRPMADLSNGRITGIEALPRWNRPAPRQPTHDECVDLAERTGLILPLGEWLIRTLTRDATWWRQRHSVDLPLAVGLSAYQSSDADLVSRVVGVLNDTGFPTARLMLWMPVRALSAPEVTDNLRVLADVGVHMGLDDFGTSANELAAVEDLPVRSVRLSRRLVERREHALPESPFTSAMAALPPLVHRASATVVVDGIRTRREAEWWRDAGADSGLGDLFGGSSPPGDMTAYFGTSTRDRPDNG